MDMAVAGDMEKLFFSDNPARVTLGHVVIILSAVLIAYVNSIRCNFQFSDYNVIVNNPAVHSWQGWFETVRHLGIRPLLKLSYTFSWTTGFGVAGFHFFNIAVHGACSLLVYFLSARCLKSWGYGKIGWLTFPALFTALLFALHPVHTEAVTYISGRSASLMSLFFLGSLLAYAKGVEESKWALTRILSPLLFVAAVATKEIAVALPLVLLLWDSTVAGRMWQRSLKDQWVHWVVLLVLMLVILTHPRYLTLLLFSSELRGIHDNLISQIDGISYLLSRLFVLNGLSIDPDIVPVARMDLLMWAKVALLGIGVSASFIFRKQRPWFLFGIFWFFLVLMPSNSIIARLDVVNERHLYLADFGIFLALGCEAGCLGALNTGLRTAAAGVAAALLGVLLFFTVNRNNDYRTEVTLWESTIRNSPHKARGFNNLGCAYELGGMPEKAGKAYEMALRLDPFHENARANWGRLNAKDVSK